MKPDDFEKQLQRQPLRAIPGEWRGEILSAARRAGGHQLLTFNPQRTSWWRELLWPCPQAWAGLAAVWVVILALNGATREPVQVAATQGPPTAREMLMALKERQRLVSQLVGPCVPAEPSRRFVPRPRSELAHPTVAV